MRSATCTQRASGGKDPGEQRQFLAHLDWQSPWPFRLHGLPALESHSLRIQWSVLTTVTHGVSSFSVAGTHFPNRKTYFKWREWCRALGRLGKIWLGQLGVPKLSPVGPNPSGPVSSDHCQEFLTHGSAVMSKCWRSAHGYSSRLRKERRSCEKEMK